MLGLDMDLEAELSVDSIKRIEILGHLGESLALDQGDQKQRDELIEKMAQMKTLRQMISFLEKTFQSQSTTETSSEKKADGGKEALIELDANHSKLPRFQEIQSSILTFPRLETLLSAEIQGMLTSIDLPKQREIILLNNPQISKLQTLFEQLKALTLNLSSPVAIYLVSSEIDHQRDRFRGGIRGLVKTLAKEYPSAVWIELCLTKTCFDQIHSLDSSAIQIIETLVKLKIKQDQSQFETQGLPSLPSNLHLLHVSSLLSSDSQSVVQSDTQSKSDSQHTQDYMLSTTQWIESAFSPISINDAFIQNARKQVLLLKENKAHQKPILLVTGGAKGITFRCIENLYQHLKQIKSKHHDFDHPLLHVTLYLVGQTKILQHQTQIKTPETPVDRLLSDILFIHPEQYQHLSNTELKQRLVETQIFDSPKQLEKTYQTILSQFELKHHLEKISKLHVDVHYEAIDLRSETAILEMFDKWQSQNMYLWGLVHGAGMIDDRKFKDKSWESFQNVVATKLFLIEQLIKISDPHHHLSSATLAFDELKTIYFSSVASAIGNIGQSDYAYANASLDSLSPYHLSLQWGPWQGAGMVSPSLIKHYQSLGIPLIHLKEGTDCFTNEYLSFLHLPALNPKSQAQNPNAYLRYHFSQ